MEVQERIKQRRLDMGLSVDRMISELKKLGVTMSRATYYRYESKDIDKIPISSLPPIATILQTTPEYLMGWDVDENKSKDTINFLPSHHYTMVPYSASAGALSEIESIQNLPQISVPDAMLGRYAGNKSIMLMTVNGESMNKIIEHESIIAVKTDVELTDLHDGDIVVISNEGEYTVKRYFNDTMNERFIFRPDSSCPSFTDIIFSYDNADNLKLIGRVVMYNVFL